MRRPSPRCADRLAFSIFAAGPCDPSPPSRKKAHRERTNNSFLASHRRKPGRGDEEHAQAPEIDRAEPGMGAATLVAEHCGYASHYSNHSDGNVDRYDREKHPRTGGNLKTRDVHSGLPVRSSSTTSIRCHSNNPAEQSGNSKQVRTKRRASQPDFIEAQTPHMNLPSSPIHSPLIVLQPFLHEMFARGAGICRGLGMLAFYLCAPRELSVPTNEGHARLPIRSELAMGGK
jgi:hypothetical protein